MFDAPAVSVSINRLWLPFLTGALDLMTLEDFWTGTDAERQAASEQVYALLNALNGAAIPEADVIPTEKTILFSDSYPLLLKVVAPGETADEILLTIDSAFDSGSLTVGDDSDPARLMSIDDLAGYLAGDQIQLSPQYRYPAGSDVKIYLTGSPTAGAARITLYSYTGAA